MQKSSPSSIQTEAIQPEIIWKESLLAKVQGLVPWQITDKLNRCGNEPIYITCADCGSFKTGYFKCSLKFCPCCNWMIARKRAQMLRCWTKRITQPKHVVVTIKNTDTFTHGQILRFHEALRRLRRQKVFKDTTGGCQSTEITRGDSGWHLHAHLLLNARWIDAHELAMVWGKQVGQEFAIVKVMDARGKDYLNEVTKYVVKGAEMVRWEPERIAQFIIAIKGIRFFTTFGDLHSLSPEIKRELHAMKPGPKVCECGCSKKIVLNEEGDIMRDIRKRR